ncbi:acyltransferase family protein [Rhizorhabdus dicambivorans]|uniref:Acyltransferase n=1 Tax=Rhizorhabdus dicambivorans TaxID=1850238 RepID=A0A2A4FQL3_9SPHN|nr:acyltransferase [Rhizorhabdus dicambivorans]ATE63813.1 acyltransferase [Rhizorhabdus dicambivorans]PCE40457.1 acyltransferase [Rhizorhabdus dicambivorans]
MQVRHELRPLTSARGIAAWYVVLYHIRESASGSLPQGVIDFLAKGYLAVDFFFVLSGFVIWLNYRSLLGEHRWRAVPHFLWRRLARIWPLHLLVLLGAVGFALACVATGRALPPDYRWETLPFHLLLLQNWGFLPELGWNVPAWSISCELGAYLVFPLLVTRIDWQRTSTPVLIALLGLLMLGLFGVFTAMGKPLLGNDIPHLGLPRCLFEFAMGTIVAALWLRWRDAPNRPALIAGVLGVAGLAAYFAGAPETLALPFTFVTFLLMLALTSERPSPMKGRMIHWFGEISYATYLAHAFLYMLFKIAFVSDVNDVPLPLIGLFLLIVVAVSAALYHGFELPAQKWMNRRGPKRP